MMKSVNNSFSFGMALNYHKSVKGLSNKEFADFMKIKPELNKMAEDVDIFIKYQPYAYDIKVSEIVPKARTIGEKIKRFFNPPLTLTEENKVSSVIDNDYFIKITQELKDKVLINK